MKSTTGFHLWVWYAKGILQAGKRRKAEEEKEKVGRKRRERQARGVKNLACHSRPTVHADGFMHQTTWAKCKGGWIFLWGDHSSRSSLQSWTRVLHQYCITCIVVSIPVNTFFPTGCVNYVNYHGYLTDAVSEISAYILRHRIHCLHNDWYRYSQSDY